MTLTRFVRWLFWKAYYLPQPRPRDLGAYLIRGTRTRWPWKKFHPNVWHNDDGNMWEVWLADEQSYTVSGQSMPVELHISMETGRVMGFNVWDETLLQMKRPPAYESKVLE